MSDDIELIKHAAIRGIKGLIFLGKCHADCFRQAVNVGIKISNRADYQGFFTNKGRFVDRKQAFQIAKEAGQISSRITGDILFSEMLWSERDDGNFDYDYITGYY